MKWPTLDSGEMRHQIAILGQVPASDDSGNTVVMAPLLMLIVSLWLVRLPFAYLLAGRWQDDAIWWAFPVSSITSMLMAIAYFRYGPWRRDRMAISTAQNAVR